MFLSHIVCLASLFISLTVIANVFPQNHQDYAIVIDAGSTGSRAFVFTILSGPNGKERVSGETCGKIRPGLASFATNQTGIRDHLVPLLQECEKLVPYERRDEIDLFIKGTAGMRLLPSDDQQNLWSHIVTTLQNAPEILFKINPENFGTISGHMEAFYAVLASNYIAGNIDANLM